MPKLLKIGVPLKRGTKPRPGTRRAENSSGAKKSGGTNTTSHAGYDPAGRQLSSEDAAHDEAENVVER